MRVLLSVFITVAAAVAGWWAAGNMLGSGKVSTEATTETLSPVYDHQTAYHLASLGVPPQIKEYFMFDLNPGNNPDEQASEMAEALITANKEKKPLGIIGDTATHNLKVIKKAVTLINGARIPDAKLIVVGPAIMAHHTRQALTPLQTNVEYLTYP